MLAKMQLTHEETGITVISGPWGIGKTTAIDAFVKEEEYSRFVIKVEPGATKRGATGGDVMKRVVEMLRLHRELSLGTQISNSTWTLRQMIYTHLEAIFDYPEGYYQGQFPKVTFIFDEAQNLSLEAIELLRFWNDRDRTTVPFPVALIFVGNNEFAMAESLSGDSVLSGAVRSRLLFEVALSYSNVSDTDLALFAQSRGVSDAAANRAFVSHFAQSRVKRDLRNAERLLSVFRRRAGNGPVTAEIVQSILNP